MIVLDQIANHFRRLLSGGDESRALPQSVHYNCICDEDVALRCANDTCARPIDPGSNMMVAPDGSVLCSESCAMAFAGAVG